jgi:lipoate-protein ligase A
MAWDEALLEHAAAAARPVLRFYGWTEPAATFGYFQRHAEVAQWTRLRPLIRRPTGGGLVPHDADWTYSLAFPPGHDWYALKAVESYRAVHEWVLAALGAAGATAELAPVSIPVGRGQCFLGAEQFDVVQAGQKIAGAAQRRTRQGLLIQGSIQPPVGAGRADFERAMLREAQERWRVEWLPLPLEEPLRSRCQVLRLEKYSQAEYNEKR